VLSDFSGPYRDWSGPTKLACVSLGMVVILNVIFR